MSDRGRARARRARVGRRLAAVAAALLVCAPPAPTAAAAKEATARGRKAEITWVEPDGTEKTVSARDIRYVYFRRVYLSVPKEGRNYKDDTLEMRGIPLAVRHVRFAAIDRVDFSVRDDPETGRPRLEITVRKANGKVYTGYGSELPGAHHPMSPCIGFTVNGVADRIELLPAGPDGGTEPRRRLTSIQVVL